MNREIRDLCSKFVFFLLIPELLIEITSLPTEIKSKTNYVFHKRKKKLLIINPPFHLGHHNGKTEIPCSTIQYTTQSYESIPAKQK